MVGQTLVKNHRRHPGSHRPSIRAQSRF
jgi:hypothetical protein